MARIHRTKIFHYQNMPTQNDLVIKAIEFQGFGQIAEATQLFTQILVSDPKNLPALYSLGVILTKEGAYTEALVFVDRFLALHQKYALAWFLRGAIMENLGRDKEVLENYENALKVDPKNVETLINQGAFFFKKRRHFEALQSLECILMSNPNHDKALANRGRVLDAMREVEASINNFEHLLNVSPDYDYVRGRLCYARLHCCDWKYFETESKTIKEGVRSGKRMCEPFAFMAISDSASDQLHCAQTLSSNNYPKKNQALWQGERYQHPRIRVAYVSANFCEHPVGHLMAGVIERHDKSKFETIAISLGIDDGSKLRSRFMNAFERFIDAEDMRTLTIAKLMRTIEVDIAVDLGGFTADSGIEIFSYRPAPIQVNYLGYAGTFGTDYMDYILADRQVIPESHQFYYREKVVYLPDTYLPTDAGLTVVERTPTREEVGLPATGFVFCSFNQDYKINPPMFDVWMRILAGVEDSVLWLMTRNDTAQRNLRLEAEKRGIDPARLVFASRLPLVEDHLARYRLADLFLDTSPFNAHTTAADALFVGLPVLTYQGHAFHGRVASSLLHAIGLPELITYSLEEYENLAARLAKDNLLLSGIKQKLVDNKLTHFLFDTDRFCLHLEAVYSRIWQQYQTGESLDG